MNELGTKFSVGDRVSFHRRFGIVVRIYSASRPEHYDVRFDDDFDNVSHGHLPHGLRLLSRAGSPRLKIIDGGSSSESPPPGGSDG